MQGIMIEIPKEIVLSLRIPKERAKDRLKEELAIHLYKEGFLSFGKARALAALSKWEFTSSPIMNMTIIGQLRLIRELFGEIIIPKEVWAELIIEGKGKPGTNKIEKAQWIKVAKVKNDSLAKTLTKDLDVGESAAIALAIEQKADLLQPRLISGSNQISMTLYFRKWVKRHQVEAYFLYSALYFLSSQHPSFPAFIAFPPPSLHASQPPSFQAS